MKRFCLLFVLCMLTVVNNAFAEGEIRVTASAPSQVNVNQRFQLIFTIHNAKADSFRLPKMKSVKLIAGPSNSSSTNTQIVGGRMLTSYTVSLSYIAVAEKKGVVEIPSATIWSNGQKYTSEPISITVQSESEAQKQQEKEKKEALKKQQQLREAEADEIAAEDLFIRTEWENKDLFVGEHNTLVYTLYYRVNVAGWDNAVWPNYKNCTATDAGIARNSRYGRAQVNGLLYNTVVIAKKDIIPSKKGSLSIDKGSIDVILNIPNKNDFWGGYHRAVKNLVVPGIVTDVKPAENKPAPVEDKTIVEPHWNL